MTPSFLSASASTARPESCGSRWSPYNQTDDGAISGERLRGAAFVDKVTHRQVVVHVGLHCNNLTDQVMLLEEENNARMVSGLEGCRDNVRGYV